MDKNIFKNSEKFVEQLRNGGAFLNVKVKDKINTMTIGWGFIGRMWNKPMIIVAVRYSRYTYDLLKEADSFVVSIPKHGELKEALSICGTKSGRDIDKFKECNLNLKDGIEIDVPSISECEINYECKIVYRQTLEAELIKTDYIKSYYPNNDYHVMIYGEILSCHN